MALQSFLSEVAKMPTIKLSSLYMPADYITNVIRADPTKKMSDTEPEAKNAFFVYANGIRLLRRFTDFAATFFHNLTLNKQPD